MRVSSSIAVTAAIAGGFLTAYLSLRCQTSSQRSGANVRTLGGVEQNAETPDQADVTPVITSPPIRGLHGPGLSIAAVGHIPPVVRDPRQSGYDAARLFAATQQRMRAIYEAEPRVEPWARERENTISNSTIADVLAADPDAKLEVECRTSSCRIRVYSMMPVLAEDAGPYPFVCLGSYATPEFGTEGFAEIILLFGAENHDAAGFEANRTLTCGNYQAAWRAALAAGPE